MTRIAKLITELAPAKINLTLRVRGRRADGYHELESLVVFADVADVLTLDPCLPPGVTVHGRFSGALVGPNLVSVALERIAAMHQGLRLGAVTLEKRLPIAAGIGGGSADGAALLRAVKRVNPGLVDAVDWQAIAGALGADVPVCLYGRSAWMTGIGDRLKACEVAALPAVLVNPQVPVPADKTRRVFQELKAGPVGHEIGSALPNASSVEAVLELLRDAGNDLEAPATRVIPAIAEVKAALGATPGCLHVQLSGGGPTCFGLYATGEAARGAAAALQAMHPGWWIAAATLGG